MSEKVCKKCGCEKPLDDFYKHPRMADGHLNKCIECTKEDVTRNRQLRIDYYREYDRMRSRTETRREKTRRISERWRLEHPSRRAAQVALGNAVRSGKVIPQPCHLCGEKAEAHHPDYDRPLDVVWLCPAHHKQAHALGRKLLKGNL